MGAGVMTDQHPDVLLAIRHREERQRREEAREREPEVDLRAAVRELAELTEGICEATLAVSTSPILQEALRVIDSRLRNLQEQLS